MPLSRDLRLRTRPGPHMLIVVINGNILSMLVMERDHHAVSSCVMALLHELGVAAILLWLERNEVADERRAFRRRRATREASNTNEVLLDEFS